MSQLAEIISRHQDRIRKDWQNLELKLRL